MNERYRIFLLPNSTRTDHQYHIALVYLTQLNDRSLSKIIDQRFFVAPYIQAHITLHPNLKHSLREMALLYFNGDVRPPTPSMGRAWSNCLM